MSFKAMMSVAPEAIGQAIGIVFMLALVWFGISALFKRKDKANKT